MGKVAEHPPWAGRDVAPEVFAGELQRRFPGACAWLGEFTGSWWALTRDRTRLVEAATPHALGRRLEELGAARRMAAAGTEPAAHGVGRRLCGGDLRG